MQDLKSTDPTQEKMCCVDDADYTAPTRQHELDHTDHTDHTDQESTVSALKDLEHQEGMYYLSRCA